MKHALRIIPILLACWFPHLVSAADRTADWAKVDEAIKQGQPKTAIELLGPILEAARAERAYAEAARALVQQVMLEGAIQGARPEEAIVRLEARIEEAPSAMKPILTAVLAGHYWQYYNANRWRFMNRTLTAEPPGDDITTWDLPRLFTAIDRVFQEALSAPAQLKAVPITDYNAFLVKGNMPDAYRPTLYDFIAQEALEFYTAAEQAANRPQDAFEIKATDPVLDDVASFLDWNPTTTETNANHLRALRLYQELLRFHQDDDDRSAFLEVDLDRLIFGYNVAVGEGRQERFEAALTRFVDAHADHEVAAVALHRLALLQYQEQDLVEALALAERGANAHPDSPGGRRCRNLISTIKQPESNLATERVWNAPWPEIRLRYRNLTGVWFRVVRVDWERYLEQDQPYPESPSREEREALLKAEPVLAWSAPLPATTNYQVRLEVLNAPKPLDKGFYYLIASHNEAFSEEENRITCTPIWVSDLALVTRPRDRQLEGFVLEAGSGEPVAEAKVEVWVIEREGRARTSLGRVESDVHGFFNLPTAEDRNNRGYIYRVTRGDDALASSFGIRLYPRNEPEPRSQTVFFTDRALYRPGQTIQYKGICLRADTVGNNYTVLAGETVTVVFSDANGKEVERQVRQANDYGSISGSFTAPRDQLMGRMRIEVPEGAPGQVWVRVEEYKRPKFEVTLDAPDEAAKLDELVRVSGKAEAYTGAAIDGGQVTYRVVRTVRMPYWYGWYFRGPVRGDSQEIAHGTLTTGKDGSFAIEFPAVPDRSIAPTNEPIFQFTVHADVTDSSGETRSSDQTVRVGYTALQARLDADEWQTTERPAVVRIHTSTLDAVPQAVSGRVTVYAVQQPDAVRRHSLFSDSLLREEEEDLNDPNRWPLGEQVGETEWTTDAEGKAEAAFALPVGLYRVLLETRDRFGQTVKARLPLRVLDPAAERLALRLPSLVAVENAQLEPGQEMLAVWGTGYGEGRAFVEIEHRHQMLARFWTEPGRTQQAIRQAITEAMRGGFTLHVTQVRENRAYLSSRQIHVPWTDKQLEVSWEHFVSKLEPGKKETWTAVIRKKPAGEDKPAEALVAEMVAALYDESLDQFQKLGWQHQFRVFHQDYSTARSEFQNRAGNLRAMVGRWTRDRLDEAIRHRHYPPEALLSFYQPRRRDGGDRFYFRGATTRFQLGRDVNLGEAEPSALSAAPKAEAESESLAVGFRLAEGQDASLGQMGGAGGFGGGGAFGVAGAGAGPDLDMVTARKNLNETAFFFPRLLSDTNGEVRMEFTMPEALTQWRFMGFAHDKELRSGYLEDHVVTSKDVMVVPNPPRFLREGDELEFTVKVVNLSNAGQQGKVRLNLSHAQDGSPADRELRNAGNEQAFEVPAGESRTYSWRLRVPDGIGFLSYKAVGATARLSDGEEGFLPVLSRHLFLTESLPLPIRGPGRKEFEFEKLLKSRGSRSLTHEGLTVQMVSNPAWYAVLALPYLMEFPHECSEQVFNRYYANSLARHIAGSDPKIRHVFDQWKATPALDSPLLKNQDLKSVLIEETPWLRDAESESQARRNLGVLFDENRLDTEMAQALNKLREAQTADGLWPWFPGGSPNHYITLYITAGFARLHHLGAGVEMDPVLRACPALDQWMADRHERILKSDKPEDHVPSATDALYLYARSFLLKDAPIDPAHRTAVDFFLDRARDHWLKTRNRQTEAHLALALQRFGDTKVPALIMRSIKEFSVQDEELGMFWRDTEASWWWYRAPIETQALMIEAFDEIMGDKDAVEACRVWLLKQKQTQNWKTTKATADAIYGLLLRGTDLLGSDELVEVSLGGRTVEPEASGRPQDRDKAPAVEAGTGFYETRFDGADVRPRMGRIVVSKKGPGVSWGSVNWQYFEEVSKVTPHEGTPLKLAKTVFVRENTAQGPTLTPVKGAVEVGDELVMRVELRVDRDMEYAHLKDQRGSGTEPVNVLSGHRWQDGLGYYESTRDTASHFFIEYLPKGTYVFEYPVRVQHRGRYQTGLAEIQCMYAPEFNSHSASVELVVE